MLRGRWWFLTSWGSLPLGHVLGLISTVLFAVGSVRMRVLCRAMGLRPGLCPRAHSDGDP